MINLKKLKGLVDKIYSSEQQIKEREKMNRFLGYYKGEYWNKKPGGLIDKDSKESEIFVNELFATVMTIAPMLTDNRPIWTIRTERAFLQNLADVYKLAGDALWVEEEMDTKLFKMILDALIMKVGIWQVYFDPNKKIGGEVAIDVVDPRTYFQVPGYEDNWEAPLCGTVTRRSIWWIKENYPESGKDVKPDQESVAEKVKGAVFPKESFEEMKDFVTVYTVWMRDSSTVTTMIEKDEGNGPEKIKEDKYPTGRWIVFTPTVVLEDKPYPYTHGKPPWVFLYDYVVPHDVMGLGETDQIEGLVLEYNLGMRKFAKHMRMYANKNWCIDASSGIDHELFKTTVADGDQVYEKQTGSEIPQQIKVDPFDQSTLMFLNGMPSLIQNVSGVTETSKGMAAKKQRQSAHEITALLETSYTRTRQRVRNVEATIKRTFFLVVNIMQQMYDEPRHISLKNNDGGTEWYTLSNSPDYAKQMMQPTGVRPEPTAPQEIPEPDEEAQRLEGEWEDYDKLIEYISDEESVNFKFQIDVETNSTLPMDQQSLATVGIQLAQLGHIDNLSLLELLHIPRAKQINERLKKEAKEKAQVQASPAPQEGVPQ